MKKRILYIFIIMIVIMMLFQIKIYAIDNTNNEAYIKEIVSKLNLKSGQGGEADFEFVNFTQEEILDLCFGENVYEKYEEKVKNVLANKIKNEIKDSSVEVEVTEYSSRLEEKINFSGTCQYNIIKGDYTYTGIVSYKFDNCLKVNDIDTMYSEIKEKIANQLDKKVEDIEIRYSMDDDTYGILFEAFVSGKSISYNQFKVTDFNNNECDKYYDSLKYYIQEDGKIAIVKKTNRLFVEEMIIPDEINGVEIEKIEKEAFSNNSPSKIVLPKYLKEIGDKAFEWSRIQELKLPEEVIRIGNSAFSYCHELTIVNFNNKLTQIGNDAFYNTNVQHIRLPEMLEELGNYAFSSCNNLTTFEFKSPLKNNPTNILNSCRNLKSVKIYCDVMTENFIGYCVCEKMQIENGCQEIERNCFLGDEIAELVIPNTVKKFGSSILGYRDSNIEKLTMPYQYAKTSNITLVRNGIVTINELCLTHSEYSDLTVSLANLKIGTIKFEEGITNIDDFGDSNIVYLPSTVEQIDNRNKDYQGKVYCYKNTIGEKFCKENELNYELLDEYDETSKFFYKKNEDNTITITGYNGYDGIEGIVEVPTTINNYEVKEIKEDIFYKVILEQESVMFQKGGVAPKVKIQNAIDELQESTDYQITYENNQKVGTAKLTINWIGNYKNNPAITKTYTIEANDLSDNANLDWIAGFEYTGNAQEPNLTIDWLEELELNKDYIIQYENNIEIGTATMKVIGKGNYTGEKAIYFEIVPARILSATIDIRVEKNILYATGKPVTLKIKVVDNQNNKILKEGIDYKVEYINNIEPGEALAYIKGINNYTGTVEYYYTILSLPFYDVREIDWYYQAVTYCLNHDIIKGMNETTFAPNETLTRGMLVTILHRMEGSPYVAGKSKFSDVQNTEEYYYVAVKWATQNNIVSGYNDGSFGPNDNITREQLAVILNKYCRYKGKYKPQKNVLSQFKDTKKISEFAYWEMQWATGTGVITGSNGNLNPQGTATRAEAASMLYKYCLNVK